VDLLLIAETSAVVMTDLWIVTAPAIRFGLLRDLRIMNARAAWMFHGRASWIYR
jgi:ABC-type sulfate transport system permease subunit